MIRPIVIAFGSRISGSAVNRSDFDFAVFFDTPVSLSDRANISESLAERFTINEDKIDLVDLATASPMLKFEVAKKGKLVEGEAFDFIRFKVRAFKEYQDTAKFRRKREEVMMKSHVK